MLRFLVLGCVALVVAVHAAEKAYCTAGQKNVEAVSGDFGGYYKRPLPGNCRGRHGNIANWKPQHRIQQVISACPQEWKQYKAACYWDGRRRHGHKSYRHAEEECNRRRAHIFMPNNGEEWQWVTQNVITHRGDEYWNGLFCAQRNTHNLAEMYTCTREDMRIIGPKLQQAGIRQQHGHINEHNVPCSTFNMNRGGGREWHHRHGHEGGHAWICEAPLG